MDDGLLGFVFGHLPPTFLFGLHAGTKEPVDRSGLIAFWGVPR